MTVAFKTFGCRLNQAETAQFEAEFEAAGFARRPLGAEARVIVLHTCAVTHAAEAEGLKLLRKLRAQYPHTLLVLAGCSVEALGEARARELDVDLVVHRDAKAQLVQLVVEKLGLRTAPLPASFRRGSRQRAALKIQDGCDFFCAYCIVPHTRGAPRSRPFETCVNEARDLLASGYRELVVTGCNIACYADSGRSLVDLLAALAELPGLGRIRVGSLEPGTIERSVVGLMARTPKLCRYLHLPIQSGSDGVLARMGRRYTSAHLRETISEALALMPDLALGADVICGFPGETANDFSETQAMLAEFPFSKLHVFSYSERPGTPAADFGGRVTVAERKRRSRLLIEQGEAQRTAFARRFVGRPVTFLVEHFDAQGRACGWSAEYLACSVGGVPRSSRRSLCDFVPACANGGTLVGEAPASQRDA